VRLDRSIEEREIMRVLGFLWEEVETYGEQHNEMKDGDRLFSSKPDGCLYFTRNDDVFELFVVKRDGPTGSFQIVPTSGVSQFKIGIYAANAMVDASKARIDNLKVRSSPERLVDPGVARNLNADLDFAGLDSADDQSMSRLHLGAGFLWKSLELGGSCLAFLCHFQLETLFFLKVGTFQDDVWRVAPPNSWRPLGPLPILICSACCTCSSSSPTRTFR